MANNLKKYILITPLTCKITFRDRGDAIFLHFELFQILKQRECFLWNCHELVAA